MDTELNKKQEEKMQIMIPKPHYLCQKCGHVWEGRKGARDYPRICPSCHSITWDEAKKEENGNQ